MSEWTLGTIESRTTRHARCLECAGDLGEVDHLVALAHGAHEAGPWYCRSCGRAHALRVQGDGKVELRTEAARQVPTSVLLRLRAEKLPLYIIVEGQRLESEIADDGLRYLYEEHQCPTNIMPVAAVIAGPDQEADAHGLFEFIGVRDGRLDDGDQAGAVTLRLFMPEAKA